MTTTTVATPVRTFTIDTAHSEVAFQVRHLLTKVRGRFTEFGGSILFDEERPERSSVDVAIKASSVDTAVADRDKHLRSTDFFAVDEFPEIRFKSQRVSRTGHDTFDVAGTLTIRGVSKPVVVPVTLLGVARDPWGTEKLGLEAEFALNRKDFGLNWNAVVETGGFLVGDEVKVSLSVQGQAA